MAGPNDLENEEDRDPDDIEEGSDAGQLDDESGDGFEGQEEQVAEASQRVSRRDNLLRDELRAEREHRARVEAELQELRSNRDRPQQPKEETEDEFLARVSLMEPEQRIDAKLARSEKKHQQQLMLATFQARDQADKAAFAARAATDPVRRKYADEVERTLVAERQRGTPFGSADRETVFHYIRGKAMDGKSRTEQVRQQGQQRIQREQARTTGGRGDVIPATRGQKRFAINDMSPEAVRSRLERDDAFI